MSVLEGMTVRGTQVYKVDTKSGAPQDCGWIKAEYLTDWAEYEVDAADEADQSDDDAGAHLPADSVPPLPRGQPRVVSSSQLRASLQVRRTMTSMSWTTTRRRRTTSRSTLSASWRIAAPVRRASTSSSGKGTTTTRPRGSRQPASKGTWCSLSTSISKPWSRRRDLLQARRYAQLTPTSLLVLAFTRCLSRGAPLLHTDPGVAFSVPINGLCSDTFA